MEINKIIKSRRTELGLTLKDVAKALGIAESTVSRYESSDIANMGIDKVEALAKVLQCSPAFLMGWTDKINDEFTDEPMTLAAHFDGDTYTEEELKEIENFVKFIKSKRKNINEDETL
jgi:transcriptional regulator with XRE-family HTH domain